MDGVPNCNRWRRFTFFDKKLIKDKQKPDQVFNFLKNVEISCASSGRSLLVFGDSNGTIYTINEAQNVSAFQAFKVSVYHIQQMRQNAVLVAVGADEQGINPLIKVWNQGEFDRHGGPFCMRSMRAIIGNKPASVSAFRVNDSINLMAAGFDDGGLLLIRADFTRRTGRQAKTSQLFVASAPITGIEFQNSSHLYAVTTESVHLVSMQSNGAAIMVVVGISMGEPTCTQLSMMGCGLGCSSMFEARGKLKEGQLVIGCESALYTFSSSGTSPGLELKGEKKILACFRNYLVCVIQDNDKNILNIYDIHNQYVAYSTPLKEISYVLPYWGGGELVVVTEEGELFCLTEKPTEDQLGELFRKHQYELAVKIAESNKYDGIVDIFRQFGDHLYAKGDHDGAVAQYIKTIGKLEESYVIRKLLDAQKIRQLTEYLQELHKAGLAREDHTTLLLNCYTNINQIEALSEFIKKSDAQFDAEIAIKVCRNSQLFKEALFLAEKHELTDYYLKIQLENLENFDDAIRYIEKLSFDKAEKYMEKYGKVLMDRKPQRTTSLLSKLCTNFEGRKSPAEKFIHIFVDSPSLLKNFLEQIIAELGDKGRLSAIIYNTLLELELQEYMAETQPAAREIKKEKIMCFLRKEQCYDTDLALGLCQINNFKPGILHLYEKAELFHQILAFYTDQRDYGNVIEVCNRFGDADPSLWLHALLILAHAEDQENTKHFFMSVLSHIEKNSLLPAILVVSIAARSKTATLSLVKEFLVRQLSADGDRIRDCERTIKQLKKETEDLRQEMDDIKHKPHVFQESKCSGCEYELELPTVHFLCGHSFHVNCYENFVDGNGGCPSCAPENSRLIEQQRKMDDAMMTLDEDFDRCFGNSDDVMATVADFFAKGVFKKLDPWAEALPESDYGIESKSASLAKSRPFVEAVQPVTSRPDREHGMRTPTTPISRTPTKTLQPAQPPMERTKPRRTADDYDESKDPFSEKNASENSAKDSGSRNQSPARSPRKSPRPTATNQGQGKVSAGGNPFGDAEFSEAEVEKKAVSTNPFGDDDF